MSEEIGELFNTITTIYINDRPVQAKLPSALQDSVIRKIDGKYYIEYGILDYIEHLQQKVEQLEKEIDRLNNIINELEEYIKPYLYMLNGIQDRDIYEQCQLDDFTDIMKKLQELKENK